MNDIKNVLVNLIVCLQPVVGWGRNRPGHLLPTDPGKVSSLCIYYMYTCLITKFLMVKESVD